MTSYNNSTGMAAQIAVMGEQGPAVNERLFEYNTFLTDGFGKSVAAGLGPNGLVGVGFNTPGVPQQIDGIYNDDSYRASRHLINSITPDAADMANADMLRESSLARQLQDKDERPATIRLIRRRDKNEIALPTAGINPIPWVNIIPPNTKFFLENVQENREEKVQVMDTFGEYVAFFFGRKPEVYSYSGTLLNAKNHDWKNEFLENYEYFLRGSQAVKYRATMILQYDDVIVEGYMMNCSIRQAAEMDKAVPFSFNLLVLNRSPLNPRNILAMRYRRSKNTTAEQELFSSMQEMLDLTKAGRVDDLDTFLLMREYFNGNYVPAAGTATHPEDKGQINTTTNSVNGAVGGTNQETTSSSNFTAGRTVAMTGAGINLNLQPLSVE